MAWLVCCSTTPQLYKGVGLHITKGDMEEQIIDAAFDNITPVIESSVILAGEYCKKCGRTVMTDMDMQYAMRFAARNVAGRTQGPLFPELMEEAEDVDSDEEFSDLEEVDEEEEPFTRYQGDDPQMNAINECYDTWDSWVPASPLEKMLKSAIDSREHRV